ncbi:MAG: SDR family NAD(P)-dependent oxidoreductase [Alphaproteobacteria bacterium]|nr:SDR family NAD(P)-dependent oxidoreductase [Alphaproteobacteria bacterium]
MTISQIPRPRHWFVLGARTSLGQAFLAEIMARGDIATPVYRTLRPKDTPDERSPETIRADILKAGDRSALLGALKQGPSGIVFAHGLYIRTPSDSDAATMHETVFAAPMTLIREIAEINQAGGHDIKTIVIGSAAAHRPAPRNPPYAAAKAALEHAVRTLQQEGTPGITIGIPGFLRGGGDRRGLAALLPPEEPTAIARRLLAWSRQGSPGGATHPLWGALMRAAALSGHLMGSPTAYQHEKNRNRAAD